METTFNELINKMRLRKRRLKKYVFADRRKKAIWSFNTKEERNDFIFHYCYVYEFRDLKFWNNNKIIILH